jgi:hypothetical protein
MRSILAFLLAICLADAARAGFEGAWDTAWTDPNGGVHASEVILESSGTTGLWGTEAGVNGRMEAKLSTDGLRLSGRWGVNPDDTSAGTFILKLLDADRFIGCWMLASAPRITPMIWTGGRSGAASPPELSEADIPAECLPGA